VKKNSIEIAEEKFAKKRDITVCMVINSGVVYQGGFYPDCYLEGYEGFATYCIEVDGWLHLFTPNGRFAKAFKIDRALGAKGYRKILNRLLK